MGAKAFAEYRQSLDGALCGREQQVQILLATLVYSAWKTSGCNSFSMHTTLITHAKSIVLSYLMLWALCYSFSSVLSLHERGASARSHTLNKQCNFCGGFFGGGGWVWFQVGAFLYGVCMSPLCLRGLRPGTPAPSHCPNTCRWG